MNGRDFLFPAILPFLFEVNVLHSAPFTDERTQQPAHNTDNQGAEKGCPKGVHLETGDHTGRHLQQHGIDDESEKTEGEDVDGQGEDDQNWTEKSVKDTKHGRCEKGAHKTLHLYSIDHVGSDQDRQR